MDAEEAREVSTRERIVLANAQRLFAQYGSAGVTLAEIAEGYKCDGSETPAAGGQVSLGGLRKLFPKKEDILRRIFDIWWDRILNAIVQETKRSAPSRDRFLAILELVPRLLVDDLDATAVLIRERWPAEPGQPRRECPKSLRCLKVLTDLVGELEKDGALASDLGDAGTVVHCFYGAIEHGMLDAYVEYNEPEQGDGPSRVLEAKKLLRANDRVEQLIRVVQAMANGILQNGPAG